LRGETKSAITFPSFSLPETRYAASEGHLATGDLMLEQSGPRLSAPLEQEEGGS
jgi:hypothetical protein